MSIDELLKQQISELTDFNLDNLKQDTLIEEIGFDSLDFLSIQVALKREFDFLLDFDLITENMPKKYADFLKCIELQFKGSML